MEGFIHDLRFGARALWRNPGFTLVAVVTLALGIGANVAMLSLTKAVLFRELPYQDADRAMVVWREVTGGSDRRPISIPTFRDWEERNRAFQHLAMFRPSSFNLITAGGEPERINGLMASADFLRALAIKPVLGRDFLPEDDQPGAPRTAMMSHELWQSRFGGDPQITGKMLSINGRQHSVIAVFPPRVNVETLGWLPIGDLLLPIGIFHDRLPVEDRAARPSLLGVGRLQDGVTIEAARGDLSRIADELAAEHPNTDKDAHLEGLPLRDEAVRGSRSTLQILLAAVGFILLIVCANLLHMVLTRAALRDQEMATRRALGAGRGRLIRQLLTESFLVALLGGMAGMLAASQILNVLPHLLVGIAHADEARITPLIVASTLLLSLVASLLIGLIPALQTTRLNRQRSFGSALGMKNLALPRQHRLRQGLIVFELAIALVALVGAGLMLGTLARLRTQDPGFDTARLLTLQFGLPQSEYELEPDRVAFCDALLSRVKALPGVEAAAVTSRRPMDGELRVSGIAAGDRELPPVLEMANGLYQMVSPRYFRTLGIPLLSGRDLENGDDDRREAQRVAVISESLAEHLWPGKDPIGRPIVFEFRGSINAPDPQPRQVVGVVGDVRSISLREPPRFAVYAPYAQRPVWFESKPVPAMTLVVRAAGEPLDLAGPVRAQLLELDPHLPVYGIRTMADLVAAQLDDPRSLSALLFFIAALTLLLAMVGVYGVISCNVAAMTGEIGVRVAFGASPRRILHLLLKQSLVALSAGVLIGLVAASILSRFMSSVIYGVEILDPLLVLAVVSALAISTLAATLIPAWRAMNIHPTEALRYE